MTKDIQAYRLFLQARQSFIRFTPESLGHAIAQLDRAIARDPMFALAHGEWKSGLRFNALSPLAVLMLVSLCRGGAMRDRLWKAGLIAFAAYGLTRVLWPEI